MYCDNKCLMHDECTHTTDVHAQPSSNRTLVPNGADCDVSYHDRALKSKFVQCVRCTMEFKHCMISPKHIHFLCVYNRLGNNGTCPQSRL